MGFMENISTRECEFEKYIEMYHGQAVVLFGYGLATENMYKLLVNRGIEPHHVVVNKRFLESDMQLCGKKVEAIEEIYNSVIQKIDVIMMPQGYQKSWLKPFGDKINRVLFYDVTPALGSDGGVFQYAHIHTGWIEKRGLIRFIAV